MSDSPTPNNSSWHKSRWFKLAAGVAAVFLLVGLLVPYFLNVDRYRASISTLISEQTGRRVTLGMIRARMLPQVGFDVAGFHMDNPQGFVAGEFIAAEHVRGTFAFWPLVLHRELRITSLELTRPKLVLLQNDRGQNNYTFSTAPPSIAAVQPKYLQANFAAALQQDDAPAPPVDSVLQIDELILRDAAVVYGIVDAGCHTVPVVQSAGLNATLRHLQMQPLVIRDWQANAALNGARVTLANWSGAVTFRSGSVTLQKGDLESAFSADFAAAARVNGSLSVPDVEHGAVKFDLGTDDLNVDALKAATKTAGASGPFFHTVSYFVSNLSAEDANPTSSSAAGGAAANHVAPPPPNGLLAQGRLSAKKIRWGAYQAGPGSADLRFYSDRMEVWPITLRFAGGSVQASARTDSRQSPQRFAVNLEARNLSMEQLLGATPSLRGKFAGTGELDLQVFGSLVSAWQRSLTGKGQFAVRNGRISGFNLSGAALSLASLAGIGGNTTFTAITGDLDIAQQRVSSRDIHLDSSLGTLDLKGSSGLDSALNYEGQINPQLGSAAAPAAGNSGSSLADAIGKMLSKNGVKLTVPFVLHGTWQHPQILPGHGAVTFPPPAASHSTGNGLSYPNLFQQ